MLCHVCTAGFQVILLFPTFLTLFLSYNYLQLKFLLFPIFSYLSNSAIQQIVQGYHAGIVSSLWHTIKGKLLISLLAPHYT